MNPSEEHPQTRHITNTSKPLNLISTPTLLPGHDLHDRTHRRHGPRRNPQSPLRKAREDPPSSCLVLTRAVGKYVDAHDYNDLAVSASISNSLLLHFRPGEHIIAQAGGLNTFMGFQGLTFTDCGGFQVSSEGLNHTLTKQGIRFRNPYSGVAETITPRSIMHIQEAIGADVAMAFDDMAAYGSDHSRFTHAAENTLRWHQESLTHHSRAQQLLFGICQGGFDPNLRAHCAQTISALNFDGYAIGGVAIGEPKTDMYLAIHAALPHLPKNKPRYVMGVGSPEDIV
ncbi:MAG: tRNA-guanine transglycosylase, partial [Nitrosarchaeum sp.]|nr:tRNA-guanine transglycosylase [Nitrosarchaeum sp.]